MTRYEHTQPGYVVLGAGLGSGLLGGFLVVLLVERPATPSVWLAVGILTLVTLLFGSLTVRVGNDTLIWYFGPRFWRNTLPLSSIERVEPVRNSVWHGWGIRRIQDGWLYNVAGLEAVEIRTNDGDTIRIGTDEPDRLAAVLQEAVG